MFQEAQECSGKDCLGCKDRKGSFTGPDWIWRHGKRTQMADGIIREMEKGHFLQGQRKEAAFPLLNFPKAALNSAIFVGSSREQQIKWKILLDTLTLIRSTTIGQERREKGF